MKMIKHHLTFFVKKHREYLKHPLGKVAAVAIIIMSAGIAYTVTFTNPHRTASAQVSPFDPKIVECLQKPRQERQTCAAAIGQEINTTYATPAEKLSECLKFRPYFDRYCQESLSN